MQYHRELDWQERALHYGDGLFETLLKQNNEIPLWQEHFERLANGCGRLSITTPDEQWLRSEVNNSTREHESCVIKIMVSRGRGGRGIKMPTTDQSSVFVFTYPWSKPSQQEVKTVICKTRLPINPNLAGLKHLNRLDYVLAALELRQTPDVNEGLLCDIDGYLVEGIVSNLFFVIENQLYTPSLELAGVAGIMRQRIIDTCKHMEIPINIGRYRAELLENVDEVFLCNSVRGISPVTAIDEQQVVAGNMTIEIASAIAGHTGNPG